jgi:hypothetical protein
VISRLMTILIACENQLGWVPDRRGQSLHQARALMHHVMSAAMARQGYSEADLELAVAYCRLRREPITSPLALLGLVKEARARAGAPEARAGSLDEQQQHALDWEAEADDGDSRYWIGRLTRSTADGLRDTLIEWADAGRGA